MAGRFAGKTIVLGVTGSIAAYKACDIASRLVEQKAEVIPVLTKSAQEFVGAISFEAMTNVRVITGMFQPPPTMEIEHIAVAKRADLFLIAPASANIIAKAAQGLADDWLSTTLLATRAPILFAPAMNTNMYTHPATQQNIKVLQERGCQFVGPGEGKLACGDVGPGRLIETPAILEAAQVALHADKSLAGKKVLITSGANHEPIDPVRFIGNRSTGKMGYALALEALCRGAEVTVVTGPATIMPPQGAAAIQVQTAREMLDAVEARFDTCDIFISAAAVADYHCADPATSKHKRSGESLSLTLEPNPDIAATMGQKKQPHQITVGFAAETDDILTHAAAKREKKNLDFIVANRIGGEGCAIGADTAEAWILGEDAPTNEPLKLSKEALAGALFDQVEQKL